MAKYFNQEELTCHCCNECQMNEDFMNKLLKVRADFGQPMIVSSAYRCELHNSAVGGAPNSQHIRGNAIDIFWDDYSAMEKYQLLESVLAYDLRGIGLSHEFIHFDNRKGVGKMWFY